MHVTSNPYFAFHDDIFPKSFSKNSYTQNRFPEPGVKIKEAKIIIPDFFFTLLNDDLKHISTVKMKLNATNRFGFQINVY